MSSSPPMGAFGEQLTCPVCCEFFEGRIFQCSQGHSICETCMNKIGQPYQRECPQCRGAFVGTRNYCLEAVCKQLKHIRASVLVKKTPDSADASNANGTTNEKSEEVVEIDDVKLTEAIADFIKNIPDPATHEENTAAPQESRVSSPITLQLQDIFRRNDRCPPQPRGSFTCCFCTEKVPACRMLNHLRSFHVDNLTASRLEASHDDFNMNYTFDCNSFRQAIHVAQYGLFFLIVNVARQLDNRAIISSWVQCVGRNIDCKYYKFNLQMKIGNVIACFSDYVYSDSTDASYIEQKRQCLYHETNISPNPMISVDVTILKSTGNRVGRRSTTTTIMPISN